MIDAWWRWGLAALAALLLAGCDQGSVSRNYVTAVGSSTVYPFATTAAELMVDANPDLRIPKIESTGTGGGIERFCAGIGAATPDIVNASRRMKPSEYATCQRNGAGDIMEIQIGIDGLALAQSATATPLSLTRAQLYRAIAARPYGRPNTSHFWSDIDPSLPHTPISVLGPPSTSGTFDAFKELILGKGCAEDPAMRALKERDKAQFEAVCLAPRGPPWFLEQGENDNLIVQKLARNPASVGIFGYSYLNANRDLLRDVPIDGVAASPADILSGRYPGARPLYVYVKRRHLDAIPGLRAYLDAFMLAARPGGPLERRGMIALHPDDYAAMAAAVRAATPLDPATLGDHAR